MYYKSDKPITTNSNGNIMNNLAANIIKHLLQSPDGITFYYLILKLLNDKSNIIEKFDDGKLLGTISKLECCKAVESLYDDSGTLTIRLISNVNSINKDDLLSSLCFMNNYILIVYENESIADNADDAVWTSLQIQNNTNK